MLKYNSKFIFLLNMSGIFIQQLLFTYAGLKIKLKENKKKQPWLSKYLLVCTPLLEKVKTQSNWLYNVLTSVCPVLLIQV